ncbi:hypothetical protein D3C79_1109590 [compost metagenome]
MHDTVRAFAVRALVIKMKAVNFFFTNSGFRPGTCHPVAFPRVQGQHLGAGVVPGHCQVPTGAET